MWRLKDRDSFHESKKRLAAGGRGKGAKSKRQSEGKEQGPDEPCRELNYEGGTEAAETGARKVPGAGATTVHGGIWDTCFSTLSRLRTGMSAFLHSILQARGSKTGPPRGRVWPMALPYPEVHLKRRRCSSEEL